MKVCLGAAQPPKSPTGQHAATRRGCARLRCPMLGTLSGLTARSSSNAAAASGRVREGRRSASTAFVRRHPCRAPLSSSVRLTEMLTPTPIKCLWALGGTPIVAGSLGYVLGALISRDILSPSWQLVGLVINGLLLLSGLVAILSVLSRLWVRIVLGAAYCLVMYGIILGAGVLGLRAAGLA